LLCAPFLAGAQAKFKSLPKGAVVLETRQLGPINGRSRTMVLWMMSPKKNPLTYKRDETYTCPDQTRGSYYQGPTRVSLIDSSTSRVVNTITISSYDSDSGDTLDLPYDIRRGYYYRVDKVSPRTGQGIPTIISLRDFNADGKALEFALYDAPACMGLQTTLIGYSEKQDKVIQYPIQLEVTEEGKRGKWNTLWADYLLTNKPGRSGQWKYEVDYRGRGGSLDKWEVKYNASKEQFEGTLVRVSDTP
jgi:hypothetical protein